MLECAQSDSVVLHSFRPSVYSCASIFTMYRHFRDFRTSREKNDMKYSNPHLTIIGGHACDIAVCSGQCCCDASIGVICAFICVRKNDILILDVNCTWVVMKAEESHIPT